ncbi:MAG: Asp-tRNA(Asn)/Glu-tRNA(Gln) amidotransferase subunit GatC [bacterium]|nr:Asp-tRNA(Asn)/Glu-tRNA(Gln) amidotransferase subunit GatC [bacterium]
MLTKEEIRHVSNLARIKITDKEEEKMKAELSSILGYIEQLNSVNTEGIEPLYQTTGLVNAMREDRYREDFKMDEQLNEKLIGQAPQRENRFIKVKPVFSSQ